MSVGKSVRLFLADGSPGGLLTAEIMNWTGHVVAAPRSEIGELLSRPESRRTGIYVLLGDDPDSQGELATYIGEADDISTRLRMHARPEESGGKDFWDRLVILTSKDANLTKAHARYLESRLIALAKTAKRSEVINATCPSPIQLPEADRSDMEYFLSQALLVFPVLGINLFRTARPIATTDVNQTTNANVPVAAGRESPVFELTVPRHEVVARAQEIDGEFTVLEGSLARPEWVGTHRHPGYQQMHERLLADGSLEPTAKGLARFTRDVTFSSPSAGGAVVTGRACNGRVEWKNPITSETFGEWQSRGLETSHQDGMS